MSIENISVAQYLSGKIRQGYSDGSLVDYNSAARPSNFTHHVYPDRPRIIDLLKNKNNFPRISIELVDNSTIKRMGMRCTQHHDLVQLVLNIWSPPNLTCTISSVSGEDHTFVTGTDDYELDNLPVSITGNAIDGTMSGGAHSFVKGTDYELIDADFDGFYDSISWLGVDLPDNGTDFTVAYNRRASGAELCRIIAKDVHDYIKDNWIDWHDEDQFVNYYRVISSRPVPLDGRQNVNRYEIYCSFKGTDIGDIL